MNLQQTVRELEYYIQKWIVGIFLLFSNLIFFDKKGIIKILSKHEIKAKQIIGNFNSQSKASFIITLLRRIIQSYQQKDTFEVYQYDGIFIIKLIYLFKKYYEAYNYFQSIVMKEEESQYLPYDVIDKANKQKTKSLYFNTNALLSDIAEQILQEPQWKGSTINFLDKNDVQIPKKAEKNLKLKKFYTQPKIYIKAVPLPSKRMITFIERKTNEVTSVLIDTNLMLKQAKDSLKGKYKDVAFYKVDALGAISKLSQQSQKDTPISFIVKNQSIQYEGYQKQLTPQESAKKQEEKKTKSIQNAQKTKEQVDQLLRDLESYSKKQKAKNKQQQKEREEILNNISTRLNLLGVNFTKEKVDTAKIISQLSSMKKESQSFIGRLTSSPQLTPQKMAQRFPNLICKRFFMEKQVDSSENIVDFDSSKFSITTQSVGISSKQLSFSEKSSFQSFQKKYKQQSSGASVEAVVSTPMFFVKAGIDAQKSQVKQSSKLTTQTQQTFTQLYFAVYKGKGILITQQSIKIKQAIVQKFKKLLKDFQHITDQLKSKKESKEFIQVQDKISDLEKRIIDFLKSYGYQVDIGNYLFGNIFMLKNSFTYNAKEQFAEVQSVAQSSLSVSVSGGYGMFAASARANTSSGSGQSSGTTQRKSKITQVSQLFSNPPVNNLSQWKQIMVFCPEYWNLLDTATKRWPIYDILVNSRNNCADNTDFKDFLNEAYVKYAEKQVTSQVKSQLRIALVGPSGAGKSTFANTFVGNFIDKPFGVSNSSKSMTDKVQRVQTGNQIVYDTPGFGDNTQKFQAGQLDRLITDQLMKENKGLSIIKSKSISAFLIITKPSPRLDVQNSLKYMLSMFGQKFIQSSIFVFNYKTNKDRVQSDEQFIDLLRINLRTVFPKNQNLIKMNLNDRIYFNYYPKLDQDSQYRSYQRIYKKKQLLMKIQKLKATPYTSQLYKRYQKQLEAQNMKKQQQSEADKKRLQKQYQDKIKNYQRGIAILNLQKKVEQVSRFTLKDRNTKKYIKYGCIYNSQFLGIGEKGFTTGGLEKLYLDNMQVDVQNLTISGLLCSSQMRNRYACQNGDLMVGYRTPEMNQDRVVIKFKDGQSAMDGFPQKRLTKVTVGFQNDGGRYFYDRNGQLKRGNEQRLFDLVAI